MKKVKLLIAALSITVVGLLSFKNDSSIKKLSNHDLSDNVVNTANGQYYGANDFAEDTAKKKKKDTTTKPVDTLRANINR